MNLFQELEEQCKIGVRCGSTCIITIDGRAGSGKTTLASDLKLHLSARYQVEILHLDEVYNGWNDALGEHLTITLARVLESIKKKRPVVLQIYNWQLDIFDSEKKNQSVRGINNRRRRQWTTHGPRLRRAHDLDGNPSRNWTYPRPRKRRRQHFCEYAQLAGGRS